MPLTKIHIRKGHPPERKRAIAGAVQTLLIATLDIPEHDRFQLIHEYEDEHFIHPETFLDLTYTRDLLMIEIAFIAGQVAIDAKGALEPLAQLLLNEKEAIAIREQVAKGCHLILTTGGTGVALRDITPEAVREIANIIRGRNKPGYTPSVDTGDFVVVVNAEKIQVTGNKLDQKRYYRHSGYPGGLRSRTLREQLDRRPEEVLRMAVRGMLPKNKLARQQITKLKIYAGPEHPHAPQAPKPLSWEDA